MFANIFMLSLLTIIYGTKGDEGGGGSVVDRNALNFLPDLSQRQHASDDLSLVKNPLAQRAIRTPFRNTEIMTARGFGKRGNGDDQDFAENYNEKRTRADESEDYRDEAFTNQIGEKPILFPFINQFVRNQQEYAERDNSLVPVIKSHRLQIRDGSLKFRLNDGNLRIGRGFGKRSSGRNPIIDHLRALQYFRMLSSQNQQLSPLELSSTR